jgi:hypothetical protein
MALLCVEQQVMLACCGVTGCVVVGVAELDHVVPFEHAED